MHEDSGRSSETKNSSKASALIGTSLRATFLVQPSVRGDPAPGVGSG